MKITNARATFGLNAKATPTSTNVSGSVQIGANNQSVSFPTADKIYSITAYFASATSEFTLIYTGGTVSGATSFVAGNAQVETATITAASGATSSGNLALVLTAAGLTGSPLTINVPLVTGTHTTAALIGAACRQVIAANAAVSSMFVISGSGANIVLTIKPRESFVVADGSTLNFYSANDSTLNLAIPGSLGVTAASSSANTTSGVVSSGVKIYDASNDWEGETIPIIGTISAYHISLKKGSVDVLDEATIIFIMNTSSDLVFCSKNGVVTAFEKFKSNADNSVLEITVCGY